MKLIARFIALLIAAILVIALPLSLLLFDTGRVLFNPLVVTNVITEFVTQSDLIPVGMASLAEQRTQEQTAPEDGGPNIMAWLRFLSVNDWSAIRWELLPDELLVEWVQATVDGVYTWLDNDTRLPEIVWDLQPFIDRVDSNHGAKAIAIIIDALPPCSEEQVAAIIASMVTTGETPMPEVLCRLPSPWFKEQINIFSLGLNQLAADLPGTFSLTNSLNRAQNSNSQGFEKVKSIGLLARSMTRMAALIPLVLLVLILIFAVRSLKTLGRWWGYSLTLGGLLAFILAQVYRPFVTTALVTGPLNKVPAQIQEDVLAGIMQLVHSIFSPLQKQAVIVLVLGLLLIIVGAVVKEKSGLLAPVPPAETDAGS